jgi:tetratricopeptide (TPR) repeat protein
MLRHLLPFLLGLSVVTAVPQAVVAQDVIAQGVPGNRQQTPQTAEQWIQQGNTLTNQGAFDQAIAAYRRAIQLDRNNTDAYIGLGYAFIVQENWGEAITAYRQATRIDPQLADAYYGLGIALGQQGQIEEALTNFNRTVQIQPDYVDAYTWIGIWEGERKNYDVAIRNLRRAIQLDASSTWAYASLGDIMLETGRLQEAVTLYRQALSFSNTDGVGSSAHAHTHNSLGLALEQQGNLEAAIAEFQQAVTLDPSFTEAQTNLREAQRALENSSR